MPEVPLPRPLIFGSKGPDVMAVQRALSRAGFMQWGDFTGVYGDGTRRAVHALHKAHGRKPAGYGPRAHNDLEDTKAKGKPGQFAFDKIAADIMEAEYSKYHVSPELVIRLNIVAAWRRLYLNRGMIPYSQRRPFLHGVEMDFPIPRGGIDCSGTFTVGYDAAGAKSPNKVGSTRLPFNGSGYTGTIMNGGIRCSRNDMEPGDAVMYGWTKNPSPAFPYNSPTHVAGWVGDSNMHVYSMGSYPMGFYDHDYRGINCYVHFDVTPDKV